MGGYVNFILSPLRDIRDVPPAAASGETCPIAAPLVAPENLPSVIRATDSSRPIPAIEEVEKAFHACRDLPPGPHNE
jgi:hypothetical protein